MCSCKQMSHDNHSQTVASGNSVCNASFHMSLTYEYSTNNEKNYL